MTTVDHVDATFGGAAIRFRLAPEDLPGFESMIQGSAYQCFTKFVGGFWTLSDVEAVLTAALPLEPGSTEALTVKLERKMTAYGHRPSGRRPSALVRDVLRSRPPGIYSVLATRILEAALFGIEASLASFDENAAEAA